VCPHDRSSDTSYNYSTQLDTQLITGQTLACGCTGVCLPGVDYSAGRWFSLQTLLNCCHVLTPTQSTATSKEHTYSTYVQAIRHRMCIHTPRIHTPFSRKTGLTGRLLDSDKQGLLVQCFTGRMPFLLPCSRNGLGFIFSASTVNHEAERGATAFCIGSPMPVAKSSQS